MQGMVCTKCNNSFRKSGMALDKFRKSGLSSWCRICSDKAISDWYYTNKKKEPWRITYRNIKYRCEYKKHESYGRYGGRGIKCLITREELKSMWFRDKASKMKKPTIDRINNDGNYEVSNCRFIEFSENREKQTLLYRRLKDEVV